MPLGKYILDENKQPALCEDIFDFSSWFETADCKVARTELPGGGVISTVFLGIDHNWGDGPPILFETMTFNIPQVGELQYRCSTYEQALMQHENVVQKVNALIASN